MAFRIAVVPHFWQLVEHELIGDLGTTIKITFKVKFRRPPQQEVEDLAQRVFDKARLLLLPAGDVPAGRPEGHEPAAVEEPHKELTDQEVIDRYVLDWDDVVGDDDQPLPYTPDNLERANRILGVRGAIVRTFLDNFLKAPAKNSAALPVTSTE